MLVGVTSVSSVPSVVKQSYTLYLPPGRNRTTEIPLT